MSKPNGKDNKRRKEDFLDWKVDNLAQFAEDVWRELQAQRDANEQLRQDLRDAMKLLRQYRAEHESVR